MKKFLGTLTMMMLALFALTGCTEDQEIGLELEGTWQGNMQIYSEYNGHRYQSTSTMIQFQTKGLHLTRGTGYWVDKYSNAPWDYVASHISWSVNDGVIYVHFQEDGTDVEIRNYSLNNGYFSGVIYFNGQAVSFRFVQVDSPNWNDYDYNGYDGWYYNSAKPAAHEADELKPVRGIGGVK